MTSFGPTRNERPLREGERAAITAIAMRLASDVGQQVLADINNCHVAEEGENGSRLLVLRIDGYVRPPYIGQQDFGVGASVPDSDGAEISVSLYADHYGRALELELIRWDMQPLIAPDWSGFTILWDPGMPAEPR